MARKQSQHPNRIEGQAIGTRHSAIRILIMIAVAIFTVELVIMLVLFRGLAPTLDLVDALADSTILIVVLYPLLYFFFYQPLTSEIAERKRADEALRARERQQAAIAELGQRALAGADKTTLMNEAVVILAETLDVEHAEIQELLPDGQAFLLRAGVGWKEGSTGQVLVDAGSGSQAGYTLLSDESVIVEDLRTEKRFSAPPLLTEHRVVSGVSAIIAGRDRPFGVLGAHSTEPRAFTKDDINFLRAIANVIATAIEHERAEEERARLAREQAARAEAEASKHEIQRRAAELDATITAVPDGLVIFDEAGGIIRMNPAAENMLGYSAEGRSLPLAERVAMLRVETAEGKPFPVDQMPGERALRGETVRGVIMVIHLPHADKPRWYGESAGPIRAPDGAILGAVSVFSDITAQHELQEWLEDLIRTISHDLRNPLMIIQGQAQYLLRMLDRAALQGAERVSAQAIVMGARRMNAMIQDLVDSARLETGQLTLDKQPVGLASFVADLLERAKAMMDVGRIRVEIPPDLSPVDADPERLERILLNLLTNALKYSTPETDVLVRAERTDGQLVTSVADRGTGIAPEDLPHIFERFYQPRAGRMPGGMGLGLYITRMLVDAHGGRVWVESERGRGSTFYFTLPLT